MTSALSTALVALGDHTASTVLICFPHAGGSPAAFRGWHRHFADWAVYAVNYPGRARRMRETLPSSIVDLGHAIADEIAVQCAEPTVLFGHSMGAVVALEAARRLEALGAPCAALIVSGTRNGALPFRATVSECNALEYEESDGELARNLIAMGGMPTDLCDDPEFLALVLPYVRSDGRMFRSYRGAGEPLISAPIVSIVGRDDIHADVRPWAELTAAGHQEHCVDGGHFYLDHTPPVDLITQAASSAMRIPSGLEG